jgi:FkbM family methyltransferase
MPSLRITLVSYALGLLEDIFFLPKLRREYRNLLSDGKLRKNGSTILDVGANRGQSVDFFHRLFINSIIYAFEPAAAPFQKLKNRQFCQKVVPLRMVVSDCSGKVKFYECAFDETSALDLPDPKSKYLKVKSRILGVPSENLFNETYIDALSIDDFCNIYGVNYIELIKIDTEGSELRVLEGCRQILKSSQINVIQLEVHMDDMRPNQIVEVKNFLASFGYFEYRRIKHSFGNFYELIFLQ